MKEVLFATSNASKIARFSEKLLEKGILLKSLKDINVDIDIEENGPTADDCLTRVLENLYR